MPEAMTRDGSHPDQHPHPPQVELVPVEALRPYARNPRTHSAEQVQQLAASIAEFGWTSPVLVDAEGGVLAGHGRLLAAKALGLARVPVIRLEHLSAAQRRAYLLADNRLALNAGWDEDLLGAELAWLREQRFDLDLLGFDAGEVEKLLALVDGTDPLAAEADEDELPEPPAEPVTRPGDLWRLGPHRLLCGDATRAVDVARVLDGAEAAMCFTDPPYNVAYRGSGRERKAIANDDLGEGFAAFLEAACRNLLQHTAGAVYVCMSSSELPTLQRAFVAAGGHWSTFIVWAKTSFTLGRSDYQRQYEPILYGWREGARRHWCGARDQGDVWWFDKPARSDLHPTMKPVALVERAVRNSSRRGDLVLDAFAGGGSTLIACEKAGRQARLVELDPAYCDVIVRRWEAFTDRQARREGTADWGEQAAGPEELPARGDRR